MEEVNNYSGLKIGIIMDGNGRWAVARKQPRTFGHTRGLEAAKTTVKKAAELGISHITLYAFSTENWKRSEEEVGFLMKLISKHLKKEMDFYKKNSIRVKVIGDKSRLPKEIIKEIEDVETATDHFTGLTVCLAINYGGRDEIVRSINKALENKQEITENTISEHLDCPEITEIDLIIRTAGEQRLSNFLLWEAAYSEYYYTDILWPDFTEDNLLAALKWYGSRNRKFGGVK
ncbi:MAG: di-trans,poly-cis-decaprenylcistransferase [Spirochaetales bacterium]|nr:di-trans,poly-cis-decaprenylcistransferase [Spirochaetales bacterium]